MVAEKMVRRHPHVFADVKQRLNGSFQNWAALKAKEKGQTRSALTFLKLCRSLRSQKVGEKPKKYPFDWESAEHCWPRIREEMRS